MSTFNMTPGRLLRNIMTSFYWICHSSLWHHVHYSLNSSGNCSMDYSSFYDWFLGRKDIKIVYLNSYLMLKIKHSITKHDLTWIIQTFWHISKEHHQKTPEHSQPLWKQKGCNKTVKSWVPVTCYEQRTYIFKKLIATNYIFKRLQGEITKAVAGSVEQEFCL